MISGVPIDMEPRSNSSEFEANFDASSGADTICSSDLKSSCSREDLIGLSAWTCMLIREKMACSRPFGSRLRYHWQTGKSVCSVSQPNLKSVLSVTLNRQSGFVKIRLALTINVTLSTWGCGLWSHFFLISNTEIRKHTTIRSPSLTPRCGEI
jgi:hypothetical protein